MSIAVQLFRVTAFLLFQEMVDIAAFVRTRLVIDDPAHTVRSDKTAIDDEMPHTSFRNDRYGKLHDGVAVLL